MDLSQIFKDYRWYFITFGVSILILTILAILVWYFRSPPPVVPVNGTCFDPVTEEILRDADYRVADSGTQERSEEERTREDPPQEELEQVMKRTDSQPVEYFAELLVARLVADAKVISASRGKNQKTYYQTLLSEVYKKLSQLSNTLPTDERIKGNTLLVEIKRVIKHFDNQEGAGVVRADATDVMNLINGQENLLCIIYPSLTR